MKRKVFVWLPAVFALSLGVASAAPRAALESHNGSVEVSTPCERTALKMRHSCEAEVEEEFFAGVAVCVNLSDAGERAQCRKRAKRTRREDGRECAEQEEARYDVCELLDEHRYDPDPLTVDALGFIDDPDDRNPYFSLLPGHTSVLRAGDGFEELIVVHVTGMVREIRGRNCRVVVDIVLVDDGGDLTAVEVTDDHYAQSAPGDIYYCGEVARNYDDDGVLRDLDGSFEAGLDGAKAGVLIKAAPVAGDAHRQEWKIGEAEDVIAYVGTAEAPGADEGGENPNDAAFSCSGNGGCVKTEEFIPPEPDDGEYKYFLSGVGFVLGVALEDGEPTGERDELLCHGDSLAVLDDPACGIGDAARVQQLRDELCRLSPDAFCD